MFFGGPTQTPLNKPPIQFTEKDSLSEEALGHLGQLAAPVLDEVPVLSHHHVVELLSFLSDHHIGIPFHAKFQACANTRHTRI